MVLGAMILAASAHAQVYRDGYGQPAQRYDRGGRYERAGGDAVGRALSDLGQGSRYRYLDHRDRKRVEKAESELYKFQDRWARGHFDTHHLDEAISNLQHLVDSDRVPPRERETFNRDAYALRDFRASGGRSYGSRRY